jgi:hypothetical protein
MDDNEFSEDSSQLKQKQGWDRLKGYLPLIGAALILFVGFGKWGDVSFDKAMFWAIVLVSGVYGFKAADMAYKNATAKIIANPLFSSIAEGNFREIGGYGVFRVGGIDSFGFKIAGREGTWVVPLAAITNFGRNIALSVRLERVRLEELPPDVIREIDAYNYPKPYFYGMVDEKIIMSYPEVVFLKNELKQRNSENKMLVDALNERWDMFEKHQSHARRMSEKREGIIKSMRKNMETDGG